MKRNARSAKYSVSRDIDNDTWGEIEPLHPSPSGKIQVVDAQEFYKRKISENDLQSALQNYHNNESFYPDDICGDLYDYPSQIPTDEEMDEDLELALDLSYLEQKERELEFALQVSLVKQQLICMQFAQQRNTIEPVDIVAVAMDLEEFQTSAKMQQQDTHLKILKIDEFYSAKGLEIRDPQFEKELKETIQASLIDQRINDLIFDLELDFFETDSF
ncbi:hypothetical protein HK103_006720 [Boothiomyces macroporosus]|uniref:Uncharacterized protein n=1 Tax=Boothiomyces macroporosus TaxID=261099 RepID=A0AAD5UDD0_9FUNG|nr:hypothetical protein HK103_006720 [Boothiomyces macroporosus]